MTTRHASSSLLAAMAASLLLAACGGSGGNDPAAAQSDDAKRQAFVDCMRKAGLDIREETSSSGGAQRRAMQLKVPKGVSPTRLQQIQRDCARKTGGGPHEPSKAEQAKFLDQALKFARCMRAHGIDMPDPKAQGGGIMIGPGGPGGDSIDPRSPAFQRAQNECKSFLPGGKGGFATRSNGPDTGPSNSAVIK
jgi:hypothetical protein